MFDPALREGETYLEDVKPDGTVVKMQRIKHLPRGHVSFDQTEDVAFFQEEGPLRTETEVRDEEEVLEDGTVHKTHVVKQHSLRHIKKSLRSDGGEEDVIEEAEVELPGKEEIVETFDEPPQKVMEVEEEEETLEDGTVVKRKVIMSSMVHHIKTRSKSIDLSTGEEHSEEEDIEEVVPGTQSFFVARPDEPSSSSSSFIDDLDEMEAVIEEEEERYDDGTLIQTKFLEATEKRKQRSRSGSLEETEEKVTVTERRITPAHTPVHTPPGSPRSRSPVNIEELAAKIAEKTIRKAHYESVRHKTEGEVEESSEYKTEEFLPPARALGDSELEEVDGGTARAEDEVLEQQEEPGNCMRGIVPVTCDACN